MELNFCIMYALFDFTCLSSGLIIDKMTDNQYRLKHDIVSIHAFVRRERARPSRPPINASSFDVGASSSRVQLFQIRLPGGTCHPLLPQKAHQSMLMHLMMTTFLRFSDKAPTKLHYRLCMKTILLGTCGMER